MKLVQILLLLKGNCLLLLAFIFSIQMFGQPKSHIEHYNLVEGLPQRTIMNIAQDEKGFVWLATWDGLCKFDGYNFKTYKTYPEDSVLMSTNRVDKIEIDSYGFIWVYTYNREAFRFDPKSEKYVATFRTEKDIFKASEILTKESGKVWLISESMGGICVLDSLNNSRIFSLSQGNLPGDNIYTVFEDSSNFSWVLTDNGLARISFEANKKESISFYLNKETDVSNKIHLFSAIEMEKELWFGADKGQIWICDKDGGSFRTFETGVNSNIISIHKVYENMFIILTSGDGFLICDKNLTSLRRYNKGNLKELPTNEMLSCFIDSNSNIWLETNSKGIAKFNIIDNSLKLYVPNDYGNNTIAFPQFFIIEDKMKNIWVHPHGGFSFYDERQDKLVPFYNNPLSTEWKFSDMLHHAYLDKQGNMWLGTRSGGLEKIVFDNTLFKLNDFYSNKISITGFEVRAILEDANNNIWLANKSGVVTIYDSNRNLKGYLCENGTISKYGTPIKTMAYSLMQDRKGNIWAGTKGDGLYLLKPRNKDYSSFDIEQYKSNPADDFSLSGDMVYSIHEDAKGQIWIGSYDGGINLFDEKNTRFINCKNNFSNYPLELGRQIRTLQSCKDKIYIGSTLGLIVLSVDDNTKTILDYKVYSKKHNKQNDGIRANDIFNIYVTRDKNIYIATFGGGMSHVVSWDDKGFPLKFKTYDSKTGLHSDVVQSIIEDRDGYLWINGEGDLSRFNPANGSFEQFNDVSQVISNQYFMETSPLLTSDGELIYGCSHGTLSFYPHKITKNHYVPYLAFTKFMVSNNDYLLQTNIDDIKEIKLNHKQNAFSVEFAALDYVNSRSITYLYKLEGLDENWINSQKQRVASYTNIPPGEYVFKVRSTNSNGTWVDNERSLSIIITPSFWQTKWAFLLYAISFATILFIILRSIFIFYRMRDKVLLEHEQTEIKTRFFTDISHEIRTPLTMIVSPIENILDNQKTHPDIKPQLQLILKNANKMLGMVNQILDFRKIQKRKLYIKELFLGEYIEDISGTFLKLAESQNIIIHINSNIDGESIWVDVEAFEKLFSNLLSNAIKYTGKGGEIEVNLFKEDKAIAIQVKDNGEGMSKEIINKLFTRFNSFNKDKSKPSTGIGLSIVKEIADRHHAKILVDSNVNKGSCFTVLFQVGLEHFAKDAGLEIVYDNNITENKIELHGQDFSEEDNNPLPDSEEQMSILVVEDDDDLRTFIKSVLIDYYHVHEAQNGKEGYEKALQYMPDFILSDIMMPEVDGIEFLKAIRANQNTSHIPFILLTAKTSIDDQLEGIESGANDYITKPFSVKLLIAKINTIIKNRKVYADFIGSDIKDEDQHVTIEMIEQNRITEQDALFIQKLKEDIMNNLDNSELTIDDLVNNTNLSRRVFYNKMKSLTGMAPVEFVREVRIRHAAELLKIQDYRVKEVTYMVGFSDIRYFTHCFKDMFGMPPSKYKEQFNTDNKVK